MDRRSLFFLFSLTTVLFFVNHFFFPSTVPQQEKPSAIEIEAPVSASAPMVDDVELPKRHLIFFDESLSQVAGESFEYEGCYFTLLKSNQASNTLFVDTLDGVKTLHHQKSLAPQLELYKSEDLKSLLLNPFPNSNSTPILLISRDRQGGLSEVVVEMRNDASLKAYAGTNFSLESDALAFYQSYEGWMPAGIANQESMTFTHFSMIPEIKDFITYAPATAPENTTGEHFYVLENEFQQVVFSSHGGAISELNLLLQSDKHPNSIVKPIQFDRDIENDHPANAYFPLHSYSGIDAEGKVITKDPSMGGYTPLFRRSLVNTSGKTTFTMPPHLYAMNLIEGDSDEMLDGNHFVMKKMTKDSIVFESVSPRRKVTKTFSFPKEDAPYVLDVTIQVDGDSSNLWLTSGVPEVELVSGSYSPTIQYLSLHGQKTKVDKVSLPKDVVSYSSTSPLWISNANGFFGTIIDPLTEETSGFKANHIAGTKVPTRLTLIDAKYDLYPAKNYPGYETLVPYKQKAKTVNFRMFAGPYEDALLKQLDATFTSPTQGGNPNYASAITYHGWFSFISEPFAKFLFILITFFYKITRSWGLSIILLTLALRLMLYPLNAWSIKSMQRMQKIAPKVTEIQNKYKKDPKRGQLEIMQLYKNEKVNPFSGCFPLLIQMPFLIGMFDLLKSTFQLRGASFIPGWINNLAAPDVLFSWNYPIIFFGTDFHLLPFILGLAMYFQQKMNQKSTLAKGPVTDQQKQQQSMGNIMTIVFTFMFYHFPSGLNIYWLFSTLFGMIQQWFMSGRMNSDKIKVEKIKGSS